MSLATELSDDLTEIGVAVTYGGGTIYGHWTGDSESGGNREGPYLVIATADATAVKEGNSLTIGTTGYNVRVCVPAGNGVTRLYLVAT